jgi:hypothetical protein
VENSDIQDTLILMMQEHRDLDDAIRALSGTSAANQLQLQRLKKKKLHLKDEISRIQDRLLPDIIA